MECYYDLNEPVRFRVEAEVWHDHTPQKPNMENEDVSISNGTDEPGRRRLVVQRGPLYDHSE